MTLISSLRETRVISLLYPGRGKFYLEGFRRDIINLLNIREDFNFTIRYKYIIKAISLVANEFIFISIILILKLANII